MSNQSIQVVNAQLNTIRTLMYDEHLGDREIVKRLNIPAPTFYDYKKRIHDEDSQIWDRIHVESTKFHVTQLISDLEDCRNLCLKIADNDKEPNRDRIDAYRTACEAKANIVKLLQEGPTFNTSLDHEQIETIKARAITNTDEFSLDLEDNATETEIDDQDTAIAKINRET